MKVHNTVPYFLDHYTPTEKFLKEYHERFSTHFKEYFLYHCKNVEEKIKAAIYKYPDYFAEIKESNIKIEGLIKEIAMKYKQQYDINFVNDIHIIVGLYGSNAFTHRQIIPDITFCLERLSSKDEHLKVIIAHEFGHALHNILSNQEGMDWSNMKWDNPFVWLLQEGTATYFSMQVTSADEPAYFSYNSNGEEWLRFAQNNQSKIISTFLENLEAQTPNEIFHEWFSINGGKNFGYTRLAYFIGYMMLERLIEKYGEKKAITLWKEPDFPEEVEKVLTQLCK